MKRVNFKSILMALAVTLAFLLAGAERGNAQGVQGGVFSTPAGNFVNTDLAQQLLFDQFMIDKQDLVNYAQGSPLFNTNYRKVLYFVAIRQHLIDGDTVPTAIAEGLKDIAFNANGFNSSPKQLQSLKDLAVDFLSN